MTENPTRRPLDGVRIVDVGVLVQAPQAAALLSDMGADVIKVELPGMGDQARWIPLAPDDRRSAYFTASNRGKRSVTLDLRTAAGQEAFHRLADSADVIISNFTPGTLDGWGLGYEDLAESNPGLVYAAGSAFGPEGPRAENEGADLAGQASGGLISTTGEEGGPPTPVGVTIADHIASLNLTVGVLAALRAREATGRGQRVDVSLLGAQLWAQASELTHYLMSGRQPPRANRGHGLIPAVYGIFETADGWIALVGVPPQLREGFLRAIDRPDLADHPAFSGRYLTGELREQLFELLAPVIRARTSAEWAERLTAENQRWAPVNDYAAVAADEQVWANEYLVQIEHPNHGEMTVPGSPIRMSDTPLQVGAIAPELGQHTEEVLLEIGYGWDDIAALQQRGAW